jgi:hypothetical protein
MVTRCRLFTFFLLFAIIFGFLTEDLHAFCCDTGAIDAVTFVGPVCCSPWPVHLHCRLRCCFLSASCSARAYSPVHMVGI